MDPNGENLSKKWLLSKAIEANARIGLHLENLNISLKSELEKQIRRYRSLMNKNATESSDDADSDCEESSSNNCQVLRNKPMNHNTQCHMDPCANSTMIAANSSASDSYDGDCGESSCVLNKKNKCCVSHDDVVTSTDSIKVGNYSVSDSHDGICEVSSSNEQGLHIKTVSHIVHDDMSTGTDSTMVSTDFSAAYTDDDSKGSCSSNISHNNTWRTNYLMTSIGPNTKVHKKVLKSINWNSHSHATRKILMDVFPRRVLATHSLTGKPSPAFPEKQGKKKLDPNIVNDIVNYVVERCPGATITAVRTIITVKCADEAKMLRNREKKYSTNDQKSTSESYSEFSLSSGTTDTIWPMTYRESAIPVAYL